MIQITSCHVITLITFHYHMMICITSPYIISAHHFLSHHIIPYHVTFSHKISNQIISCHHIARYHTITYHDMIWYGMVCITSPYIISHQILSYHITWYNIMLYDMVDWFLILHNNMVSITEVQDQFQCRMDNGKDKDKDRDIHIRIRWTSLLLKWKNNMPLFLTHIPCHYQLPTLLMWPRKISLI